MTATDRRVALVFDRLVVANADLCSATIHSAGWTLHAANQYSPALRPLAEARYGLTGDLPGVLVVPPGSPAERAGLMVGDLLLAVDGMALSEGDVQSAASFSAFQRNTDKLAEALERGPTEVTVLRAGTTFNADIQPRSACSTGVQVDPGAELNAHADGRRVYISTAMAAQAISDDELAMILAHELAHNALQHDRQAVELKLLPWRGAAAEREADRLGVYLLARAGFDLEAAIEFWRRFGDANWAARQAQWGHPSASARYEALTTVRREIEDRRENGLPLQLENEGDE